MAGCLAVLASGAARSAHAQMDTFGGIPGTNALVRIPADTDDWTRHFRLGAVVGMNMTAKFAMSGNFGVSGDNPAAGKFADGYVVPVGNNSYTPDWGYNNASQVVGNSLVMHSASSFAASGSSQGSGVFPGIDLAYGDNLYYWRHARVGWEFGFDWLPVDITSSSTYVASAKESTYTFSTLNPSGGIIVPTAPYHGSSSGYGPLLNTDYTLANGPASLGTITGTHEMDVSLYSVRLGPSFYWDLSQRIGMSLGAGPAVGMVSGDYKYNEVLTVNSVSVQNNGRINGTDFVFGGYVNATLMYHLENHGDIYLGAQYMPMTDAKISGGGRSGDLDLNGQVYITLGINWPF